MEKLAKILAQAHSDGLTAIKDLWDELGLTEIIGPTTNRPYHSLAQDIVDFFDSEALAQRTLRNVVLLQKQEATASLRRDFRINANARDWPDQLFPRWIRGSAKSKKLCSLLDIDEKFAGHELDFKPPALEYLTPFEKHLPCEPYQKDLIDQMVQLILEKDLGRAIATLPTGAGKTRVAIEAIMRTQRRLGGIILWIANNKEVCEQAVESYKRIYSKSRRAFPGVVQRFWDDFEISEDFSEGFMVAGVQKLASRVKNSNELKDLKERVTLVIFDEAQHSVARTYKKTLRYFVGSPKTPRCPLIGLTATPGRGVDPDGKELKALIREFKGQLLSPTHFSGSDPIEFLQKERVLSRVKYVNAANPETIEITGEEKTEMIQFGSFPATLLNRIGGLDTRNSEILNFITGKGIPRPTLVFACSVRQAEYLAYKWRQKGQNVRAITGNTHPTLRRKWIEDFRKKRLRGLVNVGVLTTGFDAPCVERIIMARPTMSSVLFHQMIGRGLRGPKFGGTERCEIIDIVDTYTVHGGLSGFAQFEKNWLQGIRPWH